MVPIENEQSRGIQVEHGQRRARRTMVRGLETKPPEERTGHVEP